MPRVELAALSRRLPSVVTILTIALAAVSGLILWPAVPSHAAAGCYAAGCNQLNPNSYGCGADAVTLDDYSSSYGDVELRMSKACHAAWARLNPNASTYSQYRATIKAQTCDANGNCTSRGFSIGPLGYGYSMMFSFDYQVQACGGIDTSSYADCTALHTASQYILAPLTVYSSGERNWYSTVADLKWQTDGNLVIYCTAGAKSGQPVWDSATWGRGYRFAVQTDGNLVIYNASGTAIWDTETFGHPEAYAVMQNDANFVIYDGPARGAYALWASNTASACA